jgi:hypothetical protein
MHRLQQQWETVTTATKPSHEYVIATTTLHASLTAIERESLVLSDQIAASKRIDLDQALADLHYAATDLVELTFTAAQLPEPLIRSGLLFAPARILPSTMERIHDRDRGRYVPIQLGEATTVIDTAREAAQAARRVQATLEKSLNPVAAAEMPAHLLVGGLPFRDLQPSTNLEGPALT